MIQATINNNSDLGVNCVCGCTFTGKGTFSKEVAQMFIEHYRAAHEVVQDSQYKPTIKEG